MPSFADLLCPAPSLYHIESGGAAIRSVIGSAATPRAEARGGTNGPRRQPGCPFVRRFVGARRPAPGSRSGAGCRTWAERNVYRSASHRPENGRWISPPRPAEARQQPRKTNKSYAGRHQPRKGRPTGPAGRGSAHRRAGGCGRIIDYFWSYTNATGEGPCSRQETGAAKSGGLPKQAQGAGEVEEEAPPCRPSGLHLPLR